MSEEDPMAKHAVKEYLHELDQELRDLLLRSRRQELLGEIHEHIDSALANSLALDEGEVRNVLDRLGEPSDIAIAEEARQRFGVPRQRSRGLEIAAVILLPIGGLIIPVVGWLIGVILLWSSRVWTTGEKLAGTLLFPGGLLAPLWLGLGVSFTSVQCSHPMRQGPVTVQGCYDSGPTLFMQVVQYVMLAVLVIVPVAVAILLARRMLARTAPA